MSTARDGSDARAKVAVVTCAAIAWAASMAMAGGTAGDPKGGVRPAPHAATHEDARVELGRRLFFDPAVSRVGLRACADCHVPDHGYSDAATLSRDDRGPTKRHAQTLVDGVDNPSAHWDGEFHRVEDLVMARLTVSGTRGGSGHGSGAEPTTGTAAKDPSVGSAPGGTTSGGGTASGTGTQPGDTDSSGGGGGGGGCYGPDASAPASEGGSYREPSSSTPPGDRSPTDAPSAASSAPGAPPPTAGAPTSSPATPGSTPTKPSAAPAAGGAGSDPAAGGMPTAGEPPRKTDSEYEAADAAKDGDPRPEFVSSRLDLAKLTPVAQRIEQAGRYSEAFQAAFGSTAVTTARIAAAIGAYCHSIRSGDSPYDRFAAGDAAAISDAAKRGLELFRGKAGCAACHAMTGKRAKFTDYEFHVTGIAWGTSTADADWSGDPGRGTVTTSPRDRRAFKTPTLREVAHRGPYMHDGSLKTLEAVVRRYASLRADSPPGIPPYPRDPLLDARIPTFAVTDQDVADLVAFLRTLSSDVRPGAAVAPWAERAGNTRLALVDGDGKALAGWEVTLSVAGDRLPGFVPGVTDSITMTTAADGSIEYAPPLRTHVRLVLPYGLRAADGILVPDTCREATVVVPVSGTMRVRMTLPRGVAAPDVLIGEHTASLLFPDRRAPRTVLHLADLVAGDAGRSLATYEAPFRTDVPPTMQVRLPVKAFGMDRLSVRPELGKVASINLAR